MVKIRLSRGGRKKMPVYTIVAADARMPRDGRILEKLGQYNPHEKENTLKQLKLESIEKWLKVGAQMTDTVKSLFKKEKIQLNK